jgi:ATP adenylyltransferase
MKYVQDIDVKKDDGCIFCTKPVQKTDRDNLILFRGEKTFVILNLYPYNNGHLMVVPYRHTADCCELDEHTTAELWHFVTRCKHILTEAFHPEGFNIGMNMGRAAGAGIDRHIHMHIVPRWNGDTNFMPVVGETKVISQCVLETYDVLAPHFASETAGIS